MKLTIGKKLTISFLGLACLVLLAGIVGIFILNKVSNSADTVVKEKVPIQYAVMNAALEVENVQKSMSRFVSASSELDERGQKLLASLDKVDMWIAMIQHGTDSDKFLKSKAGSVYKANQLNVSVPKGSKEILAIVGNLTTKKSSFRGDCNLLIKAHKEYQDYSVDAQGKNYSLPVFVNYVYQEYLDWIRALKDSANIGTPFTGNLDTTKGLMGEWFNTYNVENEALMKNLGKLKKTWKKWISIAERINQDHSSEGKLKILNRGMGTNVKMERYFKKIKKQITPIYEELDTLKLKNFTAMIASAEAISKELDHLITGAEKEMKTALEESEKVKKSGVVFLLVLTLAAVVIAIILGIFMSRYLTKSILGLADATRKIAQGDLRNKVNVTSQDELGDLGADTNKMIDNLQEMIGQVQQFSEQLTSSSGELSDLSSTMSSGAGEMTQTSESVAAAAEEMNANMNSVAAACEEAAINVNTVSTATEEINSSVNEIAQSSEKGRAVTQEAVTRAERASERIDELGKAASQISKVTEVISDISEQTNLLALNATIEAARAGEAGKGFAVVASEIKALAMQTADATKDIKTRIDAIQGSTSDTVDEIESVSQVIQNVNEIVSTIAAAVEEQSATSREIAENMGQASQGLQEVNQNVAQSSAVSGEIAKDIGSVNAISNEVKQGSSQVNDSAGTLAGLAEELQKLVGNFQL